MTAKFQWLLSNNYGRPVIETSGPYYQQSAFPMKKIYDLDDLLKIPYSVTVKKQLKLAEPGTSVRLHNVSRGQDLCLRRLTDSEVQLLDQIEQSKLAVESIDNAIKAALPDLTEDLRKEHARLAKLKKDYDKVVKGIRIND